MVELVDTTDLKSVGSNTMRVRFPLSAHMTTRRHWIMLMSGCIGLLLLVVVGWVIWSQRVCCAPTPTFITSTALADEELDAKITELTAVLDTQSPSVALAQLRAEVQASDELARSCHLIAHELGHAAYDKYQDFTVAIQYQDEICNSGYLHGVIESHFASSDDVFDAMTTVCGTTSATTYAGWECYHGVGHGLMYYTENDLPKALELCDQYAEVEARNSCANGVFMENFNTDQDTHPSNYLSDEDLFYPCAEQTAHQGDCYFYAPTHYLAAHPNDYLGALDWCTTLDGDAKFSCTRGAGNETMKQNVNHPELVTSICHKASFDQVEPCIQGMASLAVFHYGDLSKAYQSCTQLSMTDKTICAKTVDSFSTLFTQ